MIKEIKIIVKENSPRMEFDDETGEIVEKIVSTVGARILHNGEHYGEYVVFNKPTLDVSEVVDTANELLCKLLSGLDQPREEETMSKEKQIEEMVKDIEVIGDGYGRIDFYRTAEILHKKGYRKQSEPISCGHEKGGEWKLGKSGCMYFCSSCGYAAHPREVDEWTFCPNCGAKMKGGAE